MATRWTGPWKKVVWDVKNGLVSVEGAKEDYGVIITNPATLDVDMDGNRSPAREASRRGCEIRGNRR